MQDNMIYPPELPSTYLTDFNIPSMVQGCYQSMFGACSAMRYLPKLPATNLTPCCYWHMFQNCHSIKVSETQSAEYHNEYRIPTSGTGIDSSGGALYDMFDQTGGTFTGTPTINTTYYVADYSDSR